MTDLTPRQILDAIRQGLEETARRFGGGKSDQMPGVPQQNPPTGGVMEQDSQTSRQT
jgi:hypothetical protein